MSPRVHITLGDGQELTDGDRQSIFGAGAVTETPCDGNVLLDGPEQKDISDEQFTALSDLKLPEQVIGRGIRYQ